MLSKNKRTKQTTCRCIVSLPLRPEPTKHPTKGGKEEQKERTQLSPL